MTTSALSTAACLEDAAFGSNPGRWPLPPATTPHEVWLRAVAAGGQGRYASAVADLDRMQRMVAHGRLASLALSTRASFLRQLGWHDRARSFDGRAVRTADGAATPAADALIGLAADALGVGRSAASARALHRAADPVTASAWPRLPVRFAWVSAELAMVRGDGASAVAHAERAAVLAAKLGSVRHTVKSGVILAAALCSRGDVDAARREADEALRQAGAFGLIPLRWAAACLLADLPGEEDGGDHSRSEVVVIRDDAAQTVTRRGGVWRSR